MADQQTNQPTLEDFRAHLANAATTAGRLQGSILQSIVDLIDDYTGDHTTSRSIADRLDEAGRIRARWKQDIEPEMPDLILAAADAGMDPREISERLRISHASGYVARIIRQYTRYEWRLDLHDSEAGPGWQPYENGTDIVESRKTSGFDFARRVIQQAGDGPRQHPARVLIWKGKATDDASADYTHTENSREVLRRIVDQQPSGTQQ